MPGMTVLPQFQGSAYQLQQQQALAQALMQQSFQPQNTQAVGSGQYSIVPKYSAVGGLAQLGQALMAAKMQQNVAQGYNQLGQNQWSALTGSPPAQQSAPQQAATDDNSSGPGVTSSPVPTPGGQPTPQALASALGGAGSPAQGAPQQGGGLLSPGGPLNPNGIPTTAAAMMYMTPEGQKELFKSTAAAYAPTAATMQARQGGFDPSQANRAQFQKDSYVAPTTGTGIMRNPFTQQPVAFNPAIPDGATPLFDASGNVAKVQPIQGAQGVMQGNAAATAAGGAQFKPVQVFNPATNQMEYSNEAAVTNPTAPAPVRNNNPGAMMPGGKLAQYPDMQTGLTALDNNLQSYGKQGVNTVAGVISKWAPPNENNTNAYIQDVSQRLGVKPNQQIDLSNPLQRQALSTAIALHENGPSGVFGSGTTTAPQSGRPAASAPMGAQANAEATAQGQVDTMQKSYQNLQTVRSGAPAALQDVDNMSKLAQGASPATIGPAGAKFAGLFSANAAEYEKSRDNLVTNLGSQLGINSDAARDLVYGSIPSYGAPKQAVQNGLDTLRGQIQTRLLKSDYLSGAYTSGDAKAYNQKENQFDQNMTPAVANQVSTFNSMPTGPAKAQALKAAASNPQLRQRLEWAVSNGILK
jgi:hypothetical protein